MNPYFVMFSLILQGVIVIKLLKDIENFEIFKTLFLKK